MGNEKNLIESSHPNKSEIAPKHYLIEKEVTRILEYRPRSSRQLNKRDYFRWYGLHDKAGEISWST